MKKEAHNRYGQILNRSFSYDLDLFLFEKILERKISVDLLEEYISYNCSKDIEEKYLQARQLSKYEDIVSYNSHRHTIKEIDKQLHDWYANNKDKLQVFKNVFKANRFISEMEFEEFYSAANSIRQCYYCGITEEDIKVLMDKNMIYTKRLLARGRTLEIDKKVANGKYDKENMVLCCYWCNNAKSDEFTHEEFRIIGNVISEIWKKRI